MKVLHILNTGMYSGAENVVITIIKTTKDTVDSVYCSLDGPIKKILTEENIQFEPFSKLNVENVRRVIKKVKPDVIHAHDFTAGIVCALVAGSIPVINHLHNNSPWIKTYHLKSFVYAISCAKYKRILTVSDSVMDEYVFGKYFKKKTLVVGNPIDLKRIMFKRDDGLPHKEYDIAFLGRLSKEKNPLLFVEIIKKLKEKNQCIKAVMIGDGELYNDVKSAINNCNLISNIDLLGFQANPYPILNKSKILCMPSVWEGFGLAAVEALALGKPVVASPVGGLKNIVNSDCGKLCANKDEYVTELNELLVNDDYFLKKAANALKRSIDFDNMDSYSTEILNVYKTLV